MGLWLPHASASPQPQPPPAPLSRGQWGRDAGGLLCGRPDGAAHPQRSLLEHFPLGGNADRPDVEVGVALLWLAHDEITGGLL